MKVIVVLLVLVVGAVIAATSTGRVNVAEMGRAARENPFPKKSAMHAPFEDLLAKLKAHPQLSQEIANAGRGRQAMAVGDKLLSRGLARLDDRSLVLLIKLSGDILDAMDERACGMVLKGNVGAGATQAALYRAATGKPLPLLQFADALDKVGVEKGSAYLELVYQALAKAVDRSIAEREPHASEVQAAFANLLGSRFTPEQRSAIFGTLSRAERAGNEELCLAARALYANIGVTPEPHRRVILRYVAADN